MIVNTNYALAGFQPHTLASFGPTFGSGLFEGSSIVQGSNGNLYGIAEAGGAFNFGAFYKITPGGAVTLLTSFDSMAAGDPAFGNIIQGSNGDFYGTGMAGTAGNASLFQITPSEVLTNITSFDYSNRIGPGLIMQATNGNFYGVSPVGGLNSFGHVYQVTSNGSLTVFYTFTGGGDGSSPNSPLIQGTNGLLYGTTTGGGTNGGGTVFSVSLSGQFTTLASFSGTNDSPSGTLAEGVDGNFYGTTESGGTAGLGSVFQVTPAGELTILGSFNGLNGITPESGLVAGTDGNFYGATFLGGQDNYGTLFRVTPEGYIATLHSFDGKDGINPACLVPGKDGIFYGATSSTLFKMTLTGAVTTLVRSSGTDPTSLIHASDGSYYGTTSVGGDFDGGTAFKLSLTRGLSILTAFGNTGSGSGTGDGFIEAGNGVIYGTTARGGSGASTGGTIFKMTRKGKLTTLVSFNQLPLSDYEGARPSSLIQGTDGSFYGTTYTGGIPLDGNPIGYGTVFKMTGAGQLTTLASFNGTNGAYPAHLIEGHDHNFYGITEDNLAAMPYAGGATVFEMTPAGQISTLYTFDAANGTLPGSLLQGRDGNFYGTTTGNGSNIEATIFKLTPSGTLTNLAEFDATNGLSLNDLVEGSDGNFYGAASFDGSTNLNQGAIFRVTPSGGVLRLIAFQGAEGADPATLITRPGEKLYGITFAGGTKGGGTIFELAPATYNGLFYETTNINPVSSGYFQLTVSLDLSFRGTLRINGRTHPISGTFDNSTLSATMRIGRPGLPALTVTLQLASNGEAITGTVTDGTWTAPLAGEGNDYQVHNPAPQAGRYTFTLDCPNGAGSGHLTVATGGAVTFGGTLSDRSGISQSTALGADGQWPLYVSLYHGKGSLIGWATFTNQATSQLSGTIIWSKLTGAGPKDAPGFTNVMTLQGTLIDP